MALHTHRNMYNTVGKGRGSEEYPVQISVTLFAYPAETHGLVVAVVVYTAGVAIEAYLRNC